MKALRTAAFVVGAAALVATGVGAAVGAGILGSVAVGATTATFVGATAATFATIGTAASAVAGALSIAASAATPRGTIGGNPVSFKIDKEAGIPIVIGRTYVGGNVVHRQYYDAPSGSKRKNQRESWTTVLSLGPVKSVGPLLVDKVAVGFDAGGQALGSFRGGMWLDTQLGACPEARALRGPSGNYAGWSATSKLSGLAADLWTLDFDTKGEMFPNGVPDRGRVLEGVLVYDPRLDSTYPGGSGACRLGQPATYVYSQNPAPHAITWAYGHYQNGVLMAGGGLPASGLDLAPFVEWSNVCDANGWKVGGLVYATSDDDWDVLKMICQAGSAEPLPVGAQLSVAFSAPRVSIGTIRSADIAGDIDVPAGVSRRLRRNTIIPSVRLETHGWEMVPLDPVTVPDYVVLDGGSRPKEKPYPLVQDATQGAQLALYDMLNDRELDGIIVPAKVYALGYRPGDCITLQVPEANLIGREVVVRQREIDGGTTGATLTCRTEDSTKHDFALGKSGTPPPTPDLSNPGIDRTAPDIADWTAIGATLSADGVDVPAIVVTSTANRTSADEIVFDYRLYIAGATPDANWTAASIEPASVTRKEITSVTANTRYDVGIRYRVRGATTSRLILGPVTVGDASLPWDSISNPGNNKPDDGATVGAPPGTNVGGRPAEDVIAAIDAAKARQDQLETVTIPAVNGAVADAAARIGAAEDAAAVALGKANMVTEQIGGVTTSIANLVTADEQLAQQQTDIRAQVATSFTIVSRGANGVIYASGREAGIYRADGVNIVGAARGYIVTTWGAENNIVATKVFDTLGGLYDGGALEMGNYLNAIVDGTTVTIHTSDEPATNRLLPFLIAAMWRIGAGEAFTSDTFTYRGAYLLIGRAGIGKGNGSEVQRGSGDQSDAYIERRFDLLKGVPRLDGVGSAIEARALRTEQAFATADQALATRSDALEAVARAAVSTLNRNPNFAVWANVNGLPEGWAWWSASPGAASRVADGSARAGYLFRHDTPANIDTGLYQNAMPVQAGYYVFEAQTLLRAGSYSGAGMTLDGLNNFDFAREPDTAGDVTPGKLNQLRSWSKLIYVDGSRNNLHLMMNWTPWAPLDAKLIDWYFCGLRQASDMEIAARKAIFETIPSVAARVTNTENALADLPNQYATAQRTSFLEAQVAGNADSGLNDRINVAYNGLTARIEERATAIADAKAGAVAQTVTNLTAEYNGTKGTVSQQAGAIVDLQGKSSAYVKLVADAGGGVAALSLWSDQYGGSWQLTGNGRIVGDLVLDGSLFTSKMANNAITASSLAVGSNGNLPTGGHVTIASITVNVNAPTSALRISVAGTAGLPGLPATNYIELRILSGSGIILNPVRVSSVVGGYQAYSFFVLQSGLSGQQTFTVQARAWKPRQNADYDLPSIDCTILVEEFKK